MADDEELRAMLPPPRRKPPRFDRWMEAVFIGLVKLFEFGFLGLMVIAAIATVTSSGGLFTGLVLLLAVWGTRRYLRGPRRPRR